MEFFYLFIKIALSKREKKRENNIKGVRIALENCDFQLERFFRYFLSR